MTVVDNYFPFDTGPGSTATAARRWRLMARLWSSTGVVPLYLNSLVPSIAGSVVTIGPGAVWIDGYYGESDSPKTVSVSGNGMVVARMDPTARNILIIFVPNQTVPTQNQNDIYEVPLALVTSGSILQDIRLFAVEASTAVPTGTVFDFAATSLPPGWLRCDGSSVLRSTYASLYNVIGTTWGSVDGTHFTLPNLGNRNTIGPGSIGAVGATGGEQNHTLSENELAAHAHPGSGSGGMSGNNPHSHAYTSGGVQTMVGLVGSAGYSVNSPGSGNYVSFLNPGIGNTDINHTHGITIASDGGNTPHNNMPPYAVMQKMIKT